MRKQIIALDFLRGLAALTVLLVHVRGGSFVEFGALPEGQRTIPVALFFGVTRLGPEAVMLFFVLSGFLVGGQVIDRVRAGAFDIHRYAIDRCSRILVPLIPACLLTATVAAIIFHRTLPIPALLGNMVGLNGTLVPTLDYNAPLWSLAYEIWFYATAGAVGYLVSRGCNAIALCVLAATCLVFSKMTAAYLLFWAFGATVILFVGTTRQLLLFVGGVVLFVAGAVLLELSLSSKSFTNITLVPSDVSMGLICIGAALTIPWLCSTAVNARLSPIGAPVHAFASASYTIYLTHYPINAALEFVLPKADSLSWSSIGAFGLRVLVCLAVSAGMYWIFERNTGTIRRWLMEYGVRAISDLIRGFIYAIHLQHRNGGSNAQCSRPRREIAARTTPKRAF